mgnify:CR=1 FL=1
MKFIALISMLLLTSCGTKVEGLTKVESFTHPNILSGRMVVGGIVDAVENMKSKTALSYANSLRAQIIEERPGFKVSNASYLIKKLGRKTYTNILSELEMDGAVSEASINLMATKVSGVRYVTFARIESNEVSNDRNEQADTDSQGNETGGKSIVTTTTRSITVNFRVLDLKDKTIAWSGLISKSQQEQSKYAVKSESGLISLVKAIKGTEETGDDKKYPFPKAPALKGVLKQAFVGFADNLPEED